MMVSSAIKQPRTLDILWVLGRATFREIIKDKILYNVLLCSFLLLACSFLASLLAITTQARVVQSFGLASVTIAALLIALLTGAPLVGREIERRTILLILSKPISRFQFLLGKFIGLVGIIVLNWFLLSSVYLLILKLSGGVIHGTLLIALLSVLFQAILVGALAMALSAFTTTSLAVMITMGFYLVGVNLSQIRFIALQSDSGVTKFFLNGLALLWPNFEFFNLGNKVTYGLPITWDLCFYMFSYWLVVLTVILLVANFLIYRREI